MSDWGSSVRWTDDAGGTALADDDVLEVQDWRPAPPENLLVKSGLLKRPQRKPAERALTLGTGPDACAVPLPDDLLVKFRTLCAANGEPLQRAVERMVRGYVIQRLAEA